MNRVSIRKGWLNGAPFIEHTKILVIDVIVFLKDEDDGPIPRIVDIPSANFKDLMLEFPRLSVEALTNVLAHYVEHQEEMDRDIAIAIEKKREQEEMIRMAKGGAEQKDFPWKLSDGRLLMWSEASLEERIEIRKEMKAFADGCAE